MQSVGRHIVGAVSAVGVMGCEAGPGPVARPVDGQILGPTPRLVAEEDTGAWPFWPTSLRIHPLTRLAIDTQTRQTIIEVRLEFLDPQQHTTKGVGQVRIDLATTGNAAASSPPLATWSWDLRDPSVNRTLYDDVTRTYLLRLRVQSLELGPQLQLRAYYLSATGQRLQATHTLRTESAEADQTQDNDP